jgi:hypothetical protein
VESLQNIRERSVRGEIMGEITGYGVRGVYTGSTDRLWFSLKGFLNVRKIHILE